MKRCFLFHKWSEPEVTLQRDGMMSWSWSRETCCRCAARRVEFLSILNGYPVANTSRIYGPEVRG